MFRYFNEFLNSPYYIMHKLEVCKSGSVQLFDILQDHQLLRIFADVITRFLIKEFRFSLWTSKGVET